MWQEGIKYIYIYIYSLLGFVAKREEEEGSEKEINKKMNNI